LGVLGVDWEVGLSYGGMGLSWGWGARLGCEDAFKQIPQDDLCVFLVLLGALFLCGSFFLRFCRFFLSFCILSFFVVARDEV